MEKIIDFNPVTVVKEVTTKEATINKKGEVVEPATIEKKSTPMVVFTLSNGSKLWRTKKQVDQVLSKYGVNNLAFLLRAEIPILEWYAVGETMLKGECRKANTIIKNVTISPSEKMIERAVFGKSAIEAEEM